MQTKEKHLTKPFSVILFIKRFITEGNDISNIHSKFQDHTSLQEKNFFKILNTRFN